MDNNSNRQASKNFVIKEIAFLNNSKTYTRSMAIYRKGSSGKVSDNITMFENAIQHPFPQILCNKYNTGRPTIYQIAIFTSLAMYATHQQGIDPHVFSVHKTGNSIGTAMAMLQQKTHSSTIPDRFKQMIRTNGDLGLQQQLIRFARWFSKEKIQLDYANLTGDLIDMYGHNPDAKRRLQLRWTEDFLKGIGQIK